MDRALKPLLIVDSDKVQKILPKGQIRDRRLVVPGVLYKGLVLIKYKSFVSHEQALECGHKFIERYNRLTMVVKDDLTWDVYHEDPRFKADPLPSSNNDETTDAGVAEASVGTNTFVPEKVKTWFRKELTHSFRLKSAR
ncbi:MAG: hypothetical protein AAGG02_06380 [Cyanobacteria bacterium P01_H01_bin.15]